MKTRLAGVLGAEDAAALYRAMAEELMRRTRSDRLRRLAFHTPDTAREAMERWLPGEEWHVQSGRDLGERMSRAFDAAFGLGARRAAIVGTDLPWLDEADVLEATGALESADVVVGPARDGGYYLLALRRPVPELFEDVAWSTDSVLATTVERARGLGLAVHQLAPRNDVDTPEDLRAEWPALSALVRDSALAARVEQALRRGTLAPGSADRGDSRDMEESRILTLVGRVDCPLCDEMRAVVNEVLPHQGVAFRETNVDEDPALLERYGDEVPVLLLGDSEVVRHRVSAEDLRRRLARMRLNPPT